MQKPHRDEVFGQLERNAFLWCLHCERTYEHGKWRIAGDMQMCPYLDCSGDAVIDAWEWRRIKEHHPEYPETPVRGTRYPLYGV